MADSTSIEWTDATWNPVTGCTKISAGCDHCYAERFSERFRGTRGQQRILSQSGRRPKVRCFFSENNRDAFTKLDRAITPFNKPSEGFEIKTYFGDFEDAILEIQTFIGRGLAGRAFINCHKTDKEKSLNGSGRRRRNKRIQADYFFGSSPYALRLFTLS